MSPGRSVSRGAAGVGVGVDEGDGVLDGVLDGIADGEGLTESEGEGDCEGLPAEVEDVEELSEGLEVGRAAEVTLAEAPDAPPSDFQVVPHAPSAMTAPTAASDAVTRRARLLKAPVSGSPWSPTIRQR